MSKTPSCFLVHRESGNFFASMHVPTELRAAIGLTLMRRNLHTTDHAEAARALPGVEREFLNILDGVAHSPLLAPLREPPAQVGDVNSNERGSGARYNSGKAALDLIPLWIVAASYRDAVETEGANVEVQQALHYLGLFQTTQEAEHLDFAISWLSDYWDDAARVFDYGRRKYAEWNWAKGMNWSIPVACAGRHALAVLRDGQITDHESGHAHAGHMLCNLVMLRTFLRSWPDGNDLPSPDLFEAPKAA